MWKTHGFPSSIPRFLEGEPPWVWLKIIGIQSTAQRSTFAEEYRNLPNIWRKIKPDPK